MAGVQKVTLDQLIAELQARRDSGVPGTTTVAVGSQDNNGSSGFVNFDFSLRMTKVANVDFGRGWGICKVVSRGGVDVLVVG